MNICDNLGDHLVGNVYIKVTFPTYFSQFWYFKIFSPFYDSSVARRTLNEPWRSWTIAGSTDVQSTRNCRPWRTFVRLAVGSTRWGSAPGEDSATSCTWSRSVGNCAGSSSSSHHSDRIWLFFHPHFSPYYYSIISTIENRNSVQLINCFTQWTFNRLIDWLIGSVDQMLSRKSKIVLRFKFFKLFTGIKWLFNCFMITEIKF